MVTTIGKKFTHERKLRSYKHDIRRANKERYDKECGIDDMMPCYVCRRHVLLLPGQLNLLLDILGCGERAYMVCKQCDFDDWRIACTTGAYEKQYEADKCNLSSQRKTMTTGEMCRSNVYLKEMAYVDARPLCSRRECTALAEYGIMTRLLPLQVPLVRSKRGAQGSVSGVTWRETRMRVQSAKARHQMMKAAGPPESTKTRKLFARALERLNHEAMMHDDHSTEASGSVCDACECDFKTLLETVREGKATAVDD